MPRKHRRVHHPQTKCACPAGTKRVSTCKKDSPKACKGRNLGCIGSRITKKGRAIPSFVGMVCDVEAGPVEQWRPKRKPKKPGTQPKQMLLPFQRRFKKGEQMVLPL